MKVKGSNLSNKRRLPGSGRWFAGLRLRRLRPPEVQRSYPRWPTSPRTREKFRKLRERPQAVTDANESCARPFCINSHSAQSLATFDPRPKKELTINGSRKDMNGRQLWNSGLCSCMFYKIFALDMRPWRSLNWSKRKHQLMTSVRKFSLLGLKWTFK